MTQRLSDRVKETWVGTGTGTITLAGATTGFRTYGSLYADADTAFYVIENPGTGEWESGEGTLGSSGTTLARTTQFSSSNAGSLVNFTGGIKNVFCTPPAVRMAMKSGQLTTGSVPFIDSRGQLIEDNTNFIFNDTLNHLFLSGLAVNKRTVTGNDSVTSTDFIVTNNKAGSTLTLTLVTASSTGRLLIVTNMQSQTVVSASSNIIQKGEATTTTAILPATIGAWAILHATAAANYTILASGT